MASIIDPTIEEIGNPERALADAAEASAAGGNRAAAGDTGAGKNPIPEKFKGKSVEDIISAYQNLEALHGRVANELGQTRMSVDQLLHQKRENDLRASGAQSVQAIKPKELTASDLLENPQQALDSFLQQRESTVTQELRDRLARQEATLAQQGFTARHPDWQQETNDPDFVNWARQTPYRQTLAARAAQEDLSAADALLTEYKSYKPLLTRATAQSQNLAAARKVGLERSTTAGEENRPTGKIIRRADAMALRIRDPEKYESHAFQQELLRAIAEDRYK